MYVSCCDVCLYARSFCARYAPFFFYFIFFFFFVVLFVFFFQAEDGIRDLVRSRGLGDVYKRQMLARRSWVGDESEDLVQRIASAVAASSTDEVDRRLFLSLIHI